MVVQQLTKTTDKIVTVKSHRCIVVAVTRIEGTESNNERKNVNNETVKELGWESNDRIAPNSRLNRAGNCYVILRTTHFCIYTINKLS